MILLVLLAVEFMSGLSTKRFLILHGLLGLFIIPPLLLKLGAVGYRFARYYTGDPRYRRAGPPSQSMRVLGPVLVILTIVVFASGLELWLFGYRYGFVWVPVHHASAYLWFVVAAIHVINYVRLAPALAIADWRDHLSGALTRRSVVIASLVLGAVLLVAMLPFSSPMATGFGGG
jgi:hypothetical protein